MSGIFKLNTQDLIKGLVVSVIGAVVGYFGNPSLDFATIDWNYILHVALSTGIAYLAKNLLTDDSGKVLGRIG